jgi:hypothetical protein
MKGVNWVLYCLLKCFKMLQNWHQNHSFAGRWGSAPNPAEGLPSSRPPGLAPFAKPWIRHCTAYIHINQVWTGYSTIAKQYKIYWHKGQRPPSSVIFNNIGYIGNFTIFRVGCRGPQQSGMEMRNEERGPRRRCKFAEQYPPPCETNEKQFCYTYVRYTFSLKFILCLSSKQIIQALVLVQQK